MEMESAREARRRKILERGSDRMAIITAGQVRSETPPSQQSDQEKQNDLRARDENSKSNSTAASQDKNAPSIKENKSSNVVTTKDGIEEQVDREETAAPSRCIAPPNLTEITEKDSPKNVKPWIISPAEIGQAVAGTEIIRLVFVIFFTFMVMKGFVSLKPLLLLLLTDLAIVAGYLVLNNGEGKKTKKKKYNMPVNKLGISIEVGLLAQKLFGAIFMDFCIYAVIIICSMGI